MSTLAPAMLAVILHHSESLVRLLVTLHGVFGVGLPLNPLLTSSTVGCLFPGYLCDDSAAAPMHLFWMDCDLKASVDAVLRSR